MAACAACGQVNPEIARFCLACGAPIELTPGPVAEERETVTVLFCDLVGFTAASDRADPEDVRARIRPYHARLRREVEGFGGTVEKFIGDAVMAVFGAPLAHEDDPKRVLAPRIRWKRQPDAHAERRFSTPASSGGVVIVRASGPAGKGAGTSRHGSVRRL